MITSATMLGQHQMIALTGQLGGQRPVGEGNLLVAPEDILVLLFDLGEELLDALADFFAALFLKLFPGASPESALPGLTLFAAQVFIVHLAENQVEKLPEGGVFGHALVAVDVVVAAAEGDLEHLVVGDTGMGVGNDLLGADRLFRHRPVANGVALGFKALLLFLDAKRIPGRWSTGRTEPLRPRA